MPPDSKCSSIVGEAEAEAQKVLADAEAEARAITAQSEKTAAQKRAEFSAKREAEKKSLIGGFQTRAALDHLRARGMVVKPTSANML